MKHRWLGIAGIAIAAAGVARAQDAGKGPDAAHALSSAVSVGSTPITRQQQRYQIRPGDSFDVDFALTPDFNQTVSVQPDGYGSLKAVGTIQVEGKTVPELTETIRAAYATILHDPLITVVLKDFDKPFFIASGQVARPGKYDLRSGLTVTEALAVAGGISDKGRISQVILYRRSSDGAFDGRVLNIKKLLASRNLSEDVRLVPGDLLYVPQNISSHIRPYLPTASMGAFYSPIPY